MFCVVSSHGLLLLLLLALVAARTCAADGYAYYSSSPFSVASYAATVTRGNANVDGVVGDGDGGGVRDAPSVPIGEHYFEATFLPTGWSSGRLCDGLQQYYATVGCDIKTYETIITPDQIVQRFDIEGPGGLKTHVLTDIGNDEAASFRAFLKNTDSLILQKLIYTISTAPPGPEKTFLEKYPLLWVAFATAIVIIVMVTGIILVHQRAKQHERLRDTMEAMIDLEDGSGIDGQVGVSINSSNTRRPDVFYPTPPRKRPPAKKKAAKDGGGSPKKAAGQRQQVAQPRPQPQHQQQQQQQQQEEEREPREAPATVAQPERQHEVEAKLEQHPQQSQQQQQQQQQESEVVVNEPQQQSEPHEEVGSKAHDHLVKKAEPLPQPPLPLPPPDTPTTTEAPAAEEGEGKKRATSKLIEDE